MGRGRMLLPGNRGRQMDIEDRRGEIEGLRRRIEEDGRADGRHRGPAA